MGPMMDRSPPAAWMRQFRQPDFHPPHLRRRFAPTMLPT
jgi:hypothetical protein